LKHKKVVAKQPLKVCECCQTAVFFSPSVSDALVIDRMHWAVAADEKQI